jgi:hypothetical protein
MRVNGSERLTMDAIYAASPYAYGAHVAECYARNSRSSVVGWDVYLTGSAPHRGRVGNATYKAATWDQWGLFLANVFATDPTASVPGVYPSADAFALVTRDRFGACVPPVQSPRGYRIERHPEFVPTVPALLDTMAPHKGRGHRWEFVGTLVTGGSLHRCSVDGCDASRVPGLSVSRDALVSARTAGAVTPGRGF